MLKKRLSTPRAATVIVLAAVVALSVTVAPSIAASFLTSKAASQKFVTKQKASKTYLTKSAVASNYLSKKAAANTYLPAKSLPLQPFASIAASNTLFSTNASTAGYIPTAFTSFPSKAAVSTVVITFSGTASCTLPGTKAPTVDQACPIQILVDGTTTGKVNFAPATAEGTTAKPAAALVHAVTQTTVLGKGGHTISIQYAGASGLNFQLKSWNLAVQVYPQPEEVEETTTSSSTSSK
ncbi:MAG TPA: hypothetical protein VH268_11225 [Solirubrobacterales bacterium]|nr:hypothetical protein [Solirubrobacterales bacterium]